MFIKSFINSFYFIDYVLIRQIIKIHLVLGKIKETIFIQKKGNSSFLFSIDI